MSWQSARLVVAGEQVEVLSDSLLQAGALAVDVSDADAGTAAERAQFSEPGATSQSWPRSQLSVLFAIDADVRAALANACAAADIACPEVLDLRVLRDEDWVRLTQSQFKPIQVAPRFWIVPTWETIPDPHAINLILDPGAAFGTGSHPTTRLCLRWLIDNMRGNERVIDYGCGSGILAIAALRLGAQQAIGYDIDPQAVLAARANAMQNRVAAEFHEPGSVPVPSGDIVLANILANPLIALAPLLAASTRTHGHVVLSGVLEAQAAGVAAAYQPWYEMAPAVIDEGWALLVGRRTGTPS